jgi:ABC-type antimicrobial peptide transport system permease subunit
MLGQGVKLAAMGAVAGLAAAFFLTRFLAGLLYGIAPRDPATFVTVALALVSTAAAAAYVPARRAARANPVSLLKCE